MRTIYDPSLAATVTLDESGEICGINHLDEYREMSTAVAARLPRLTSATSREGWL